jgi:integrase/recombinase XerD
LDTRRIKKNSKYPLKLRILFERKGINFSLGIDLTEDDFKSLNSKEIPDYLQLLSETVMRYKLDAGRIIRELEPFTFEAFRNRFNKGPRNDYNVFPIFESYILELKKAGRSKTAKSYESALRSIKSFIGKDVLRFQEVSPRVLKDYEQWLLNKGNSISTVGLYNRCLRTIFNYAISENIIKRNDTYPFGKWKYLIPSSQSIKKALKKDDLKLLADYIPQGKYAYYQERARDLWLFSYLCNGMNFKDICLLKRKNIDGHILTYKRSKTKKAYRTGMLPIKIMLHPNAVTFIKKWGALNEDPESYLFPFLDPSDSETEVDRKAEQLIQNVNKNMRIIFRKLGIEKPSSTIVARHTFATVLKNNQRPLELISESLGHSSIKTTMIYLDSFNHEHLIDIRNDLNF